MADTEDQGLLRRLAGMLDAPRRVAMGDPFGIDVQAAIEMLFGATEGRSPLGLVNDMGMSPSDYGPGYRDRDGGTVFERFSDPEVFDWQAELAARGMNPQLQRQSSTPTPESPPQGSQAGVGAETVLMDAIRFLSDPFTGYGGHMVDGLARAGRKWEHNVAPYYSGESAGNRREYDALGIGTDEIDDLRTRFPAANLQDPADFDEFLDLNPGVVEFPRRSVRWGAPPEPTPDYPMPAQQPPRAVSQRFVPPPPQRNPYVPPPPPRRVDPRYVRPPLPRREITDNMRRKML